MRVYRVRSRECPDGQLYTNYVSAQIEADVWNKEKILNKNSRDFYTVEMLDTAKSVDPFIYQLGRENGALK